MMKTNNGVNIYGRIRFIECDGKKYPLYSDVDIALKNGDAKVSEWIDNLIPTSGRTAIARRLANIGLLANEAIITYGAVGTGTTAAANGDTTLVAEHTRVLTATKTYSANVLTVRTYFNTAQANAALTEFGLFGEAASAVANSGTLFERVIISRTKTSAITLTIESNITIT